MSYKDLLKLKLKVSMSTIYIWLLEIFILYWVHRNSNKHVFSRNYAKTTIFSKTDNFRQITAKINRLLGKKYTNIHAKFQNDRCNLFRVITWQKIDNLHTHTRTHTHTHPYIFGRRLFFLCRSYINKGNGEIRQLIFETDSRLYSIKDWESNRSDWWM